MPLAVTENTALAPALTDCGVGATVMLGAELAFVTVSVAAELLTVLLAPLTTTRYSRPLIASVDCITS